MICSLINIVIAIIFVVFLVSLLFPVEKLLQRFSRLNVSKNHIFTALLLVILLLTLKSNSLNYLLDILVIAVSLLIFLFGFLSNRKYIYMMALVSLVLTIIMLLLGVGKLADFFSQACYVLLVLGVLKDLFYEKIFE